MAPPFRTNPLTYTPGSITRGNAAVSTQCNRKAEDSAVRNPAAAPSPPPMVLTPWEWAAVSGAGCCWGGCGGFLLPGRESGGAGSVVAGGCRVLETLWELACLRTGGWSVREWINLCTLTLSPVDAEAEPEVGVVVAAIIRCNDEGPCRYRWPGWRLLGGEEEARGCLLCGEEGAGEGPAKASGCRACL